MKFEELQRASAVLRKRDKLIGVLTQWKQAPVKVDNLELCLTAEEEEGTESYPPRDIVVATWDVREPHVIERMRGVIIEEIQLAIAECENQLREIGVDLP